MKSSSLIPDIWEPKFSEMKYLFSSFSVSFEFCAFDFDITRNVRKIDIITDLLAIKSFDAEAWKTGRWENWMCFIRNRIYQHLFP